MSVADAEQSAAPAVDRGVAQAFVATTRKWYVVDDVSPVSGTLTESVLETFLRTAFRYGSQNKVMFVSPLVASAMSSSEPMRT